MQNELESVVSVVVEKLVNGTFKHKNTKKVFHGQTAWMLLVCEYDNANSRSRWKQAGKTCFLSFIYLMVHTHLY